MSYLFSILIPNLGYSHLLFECLDSAISQITKDLFDYEIIICDQSDADIYKQIKSEIEINYTANRIQLIHSEIKSLYLARHTLMKYANGEYISFLDSDDIIDSDYLFELYKIIIENNHPDIIFTNFIKMSFDNKINTKINYLDTLNTNRILDYLRYGSCANPVCFKIFKKNIYRSDLYSKYISSSIKCGEDKVFSLPLVENSQSNFFALNFFHYHYRNTPNSMVKNPTENDFYVLLSFCIKNSENLILDNFQKKLISSYLMKNLIGKYRGDKSNSYSCFRKRAVAVNKAFKIFKIYKNYTNSFKYFLLFYSLHFKSYFLSFLLFKTNNIFNSLLRK